MIVVIFQLYHGEDKLLSEEKIMMMIMISVLY